ncbi:unnamed protein product [Rotaria sp. Silwood1]|nr:unnamed protein product [Rotaria sp. Silwood1]
MHPNHRTVSIEKCISNDDIHLVHDCSPLCSANGHCIFDANRQLGGAHTDVRDGDVHYSINGEKRLEPYALNQVLAMHFRSNYISSSYFHTNVEIATL